MLASYSIPYKNQGWIAVCGAAVVFGSTGIPMKKDRIRGVDPWVFALFTSLGISLVTFPLLVYLLAIHQFHFKPWAILGSVDIFIVNFFAVQAVTRLGFAKASATWAGLGMVVAFIWGSAYFREEIANVVSASISIVLLVLGVYCVSTSQTRVEDEAQQNGHGGGGVSAPVSTEDTDATSCPEPEQSIDKISLEIEHEESNVTLSSPTVGVAVVLVGLLCCASTGFFDGSLMVPFKLTQANSLNDIFSYLASFGISSAIGGPSIYALYALSFRGGDFNLSDLHKALFPGLTSGILWASANFMSVHATFWLGIRIGFPLTQTCVLVTAVWGIFYFKEIDVGPSGFLARFLLGIVFIIVGSYFLATSG
jgi:glucose uptake protein GlcU